MVAALVSVLAAPRAGGSIVVLDEQTASVSIDGGATWRTLHRVVAPDAFGHAALGADGTLFALHGDVLDVVRGGTVTSHRVPDALRVAVSGSVVAVLRAAAVDVSGDGGATFVTRALPAPCEDCPVELQGMIDFTIAGGSPFVVDTSIDTCGSSDLIEWQRLVQIGSAGFQRPLAIPPADYAVRWHFGAYGWLYGTTYAGRLLAVSAAGATAVDAVGPLAVTEQIAVAHNDRVTVAMIGTTLLELVGANARVLDAHAKPGDRLAVDGDDRPLVSDGEELWRFSRVTGWMKLALP